MNIRFKNLKGKKFGKLTPLKIVEKALGHRGVLWECLCDCGTYHNVRSTDFKKTKSCGCSHFLDREEACINNLIGNYKKDARYAKREFRLEKDEFKRLIKSNCFYCDTPPSNTL